MRNIVADVETDGFLDTLTVIHCLVLRDLDSDELLSCADQPGYPSIKAGLKVLAKAEKAYFHNGIRYDILAIQKLHPKFKIQGRVLDTFLTASMRWAHIKESDFKLFKQKRLPGNMIGRHSLEAWGHRLGMPKGDCTDFSVWTPEMQRYCERDTAVTKELALRIRKAGVSPESIEIEHELAAYLHCQETNGIPFDLAAAQDLQSTLAGKKLALEEKLVNLFPPWTISLGMFTPKKNNATRGYVKGVAIEKFKEMSFNPGSRDQIADRLQTLYGWVPTAFTANGKPVVDEDTLSGLTFDGVKDLQEYLMLSKRLGQLSEGKEGWLRGVTDTGYRGGQLTGLPHLHGRVLQNRAVTHRAAHLHPNLGQVPAVYSPYGPECRALFHVPAGWSMVGADASGLELRCLAHYMAEWDDGEYGNSVLQPKGSPDEVHLKNANILGIARDDGKTFVYALLYGAGDEKLGKIISPSSSAERQAILGKKARGKLLSGLPALKKLVEQVKAKADQDGWLLLPDGRRTYIRSQHGALNSLLQGAGAIICKRWIIDYNRELVRQLGPQGWDHDWAALLWIHDENELAVKPRLADAVGKLMVQCIRDLTAHFHWRIPLDGDYKVGRTWADVH